jgi:lysophospholipase L1-like esterase
MKKKIILMLLSGFLFLTLTEVFFRWENYRNRNIETRACRRQSQRFHHELVPDTVCRSKYPEWDVEFRVNNLGFRDEDMTIQKQPGVYRVLLVGDSFVEGESVAESKTAAYLAEKEITLETGSKTEVVNMGVMSYAPAVYYRVIKDKGLPLNPDLVMVNVDMSDFQNDYAYAKDIDKEENFQNILFQQQMGQPHVAVPAVNSRIKFWLRSNSAFYTVVADRAKQLIRKIKKLPEPTVFLTNNLDSDPHYITRSEKNAADPEAWREISINLIKIRDLLKQKKIPLVVTVYPYGHQAGEDEWGKGRVRNGFETGKIYPSTAADLLVEFGNKNGIKVVNFVPDFREAAKKEAGFLYYPQDGHFTEKGQRVMADKLKEVINDYLAHNR